MRPARLRAVGSAAIILWLAVIVASYYAAHKPFGPANLSALLATAADLVSAAAIVLLATAVGRRVLSEFNISDRLESLLFAAGLGLGLASVATLVLSLMGLPSPAWGLLGAAILALLLRGEIVGTWHDLKVLRPITGPDRSARLVSGYIALAMGYAAALALLPPTAWDSLLYHLKGPALLLAGAGHERVLGIPPLAYSSLLEQLYLLGMWLRGDGVAAVLHWLFSLLTLATVWRLVSGLDIGHRWLALGLLLSGWTWVLTAGWPYVDWGLAFYTSAALLAMVRWSHGRGRGWLVLAGSMLGLAMSVKYTGILSAAAVGFLFLAEARREGIRSLVRGAGTLALAGLPFLIPFLLRNWIFAGNPVYPYLWGGLDWDPLRDWRFTRPELGLASDPLRLLLAPVEATLLGAEGKVGYESTVGPLFLGLLPLAAAAALRDEPSGFGRRIGVALAGFYTLWLGGVASSPFFQNLRLAFPMFPLLAVLAAAGLQGVRGWRLGSVSVHRVLWVVVGVVLSLNLARFGLHLVETDPWPYLVGHQTREQYLSERLGGYHEAVTHINLHLPPPARVQFLWEPRSYYCLGDCVPDATLDRFSDLVFRHRDSETIAEQLRAEGITHLLVHEDGLRYLAENDPTALPETDLAKLRTLLSDHFHAVMSFGSEYTLYAWS